MDVKVKQRLLNVEYLTVINIIVSDDQELACRNILGLVHHCPTVMDLELDKLVDECFKAELPHLALILVPYLSQVNIFFIYCVRYNVFYFYIMSQ